MNIRAISVAILLLPLGALADEVQCTDIPKVELKYDYDLYEDGGTLELVIPEKYEEATFSTFRIDVGIENKHSFWSRPNKRLMDNCWLRSEFQKIMRGSVFKSFTTTHTVSPFLKLSLKTDAELNERVAL